MSAPKSCPSSEQQTIALSLGPNPVSPPTPLPNLLVGFSTKAYFDLPRTITYIRTLLSTLPPGHPNPRLGLFILPSFPLLPIASALLRQPTSKQISSDTSEHGSGVLLGAQNVHPTALPLAEKGKATGEVSPTLLKQLGCTIVELGHAERRASPFNESDDFIAEKVRCVTRERMIPLVCVGEQHHPGAIMSAGVGKAVEECWAQAESALMALHEQGKEQGDKELRNQIIFAYEPIWAIGGEEAASPEYVCAVVGGLKEKTRSLWMRAMEREKRRAAEVRWLYGGSAGPGTWQGLKGTCDGLFLGRFAHEAENFVSVVTEVGAGEES